MPIESWLPVGQKLPQGGAARLALYEGHDWQIVETEDSGRALIAKHDLAARWIQSGLVDEGSLRPLVFGSERYMTCWSGASHTLAPVVHCKSPSTPSEALAFAIALKATRALDGESPLQDAIYVERLSRLLPTYGISSRTGDDIVLGYWLTGGANVSVKSFRRLREMMSWMEAGRLKGTVEAAGFAVAELIPRGATKDKTRREEALHTEQGRASATEAATDAFRLPGRPELEAFFNEHVVDIIKNQSRYQAFGISFPSAIILHGPPGCGKTFAVERLVDYLGWPSFEIDASSVGSPYIHETSKKVAEVFEKAMESAPSVLVIDEMEAFLADRQMGAGSSHHRVEEMGEFLRRIPEATKNNVLIVAMTNRLEMIDPAILRRGRFDHVIKVDMASEAEVRGLLSKLLSELPSDEDVDVVPIAKRLAGRPLSDVAFTVREGARLAVRNGRSKLDQSSLLQALGATPVREAEEGTQRKIGFV